LENKSTEKFAQHPVVLNGKAIDQEACKSGLCDPILGKLTDEQGFRELVELLVQIRSKAEARRKPRFSTPAALNGLENSEHDGYLLHKTNGLTWLYGMWILNFSENGLQIQFKCTDPHDVLHSHLFLKIGNGRIPVTLKWFRESQPVSRGGLLFSESTNPNREAIRLVGNLTASLVDYLLRGFTSKLIPFTAQAGVYTYLAIFYSLRLLFLEKIAAIKKLASRKATLNMSAAPDYLLSKLSDISAERCARMNNRLLAIFMKPYLDFGCGLSGMAEQVVFPRQDVRAAVINSMFFTEDDCHHATDFLPAVKKFHRQFQELKQLLPGVFDAEEFDNQFKYYDRFIRGLSLLRQNDS